MVEKNRSVRAAVFLKDEERWRGVVERDLEADGKYVYGVKTTGIYCRPICGSRIPLRKNVLFFETGAKAILAGYRACKRCLPSGKRVAERVCEMVTEVCRCLGETGRLPDTARLALKFGTTPSGLVREFKRVTGLTMKGYATAVRGERVRDGLGIRKTRSVELVEAGYRSAGRFYGEVREVLGMPLRAYRRGGEGMTIRFGIGETSLGSILVAMSETGICSIQLGDDPQELLEHFQNRFRSAELLGGDSDFEESFARVVGFVENPQKGLGLPLDIRGTIFQRRVWEALREISPGKRTTYSALANLIGSPRSVRAVASACAANEIAVAIPCHRVVRLDGTTSGYRWGVDRKNELLRRESRAESSKREEIEGEG